MLLLRLRSSESTRICVISSALSSTSTAATFSAEALVLDQRPVTRHDARRQFLDALHALLGIADARNSRPLVAQQELGAIPAAMLLANEVTDRHLHVVEENLVDLASAIHGDDGAHGHAG